MVEVAIEQTEAYIDSTVGAETVVFQSLPIVVHETFKRTEKIRTSMLPFCGTNAFTNTKYTTVKSINIQGIKHLLGRMM